MFGFASRRQEDSVLCVVLFLSFMQPETEVEGQIQITASLTLILDPLQDFRDRTISLGVYFP